jgi:hypothetical protein
MKSRPSGDAESGDAQKFWKYMDFPPRILKPNSRAQDRGFSGYMALRTILDHGPLILALYHEDPWSCKQKISPEGLIFKDPGSRV